MKTITSPTLLVDEQKCRNNIKRMADKARQFNLEFRPHFKTHQSTDIGKWFKDEGVTGITVSSIKMARYFAADGWKSITIAFPVNIRELEAINVLAKEISLTILISDPGVIKALRENVLASIGVMIEIDTGSSRTGFKVDHIHEIKKVLAEISQIPNLQFKGFYSHPGHSYSARSVDEIKEVNDKVLAKVSNLTAGLSLNRDAYKVCIGDTPCASVADVFRGIDQLSPGNLVFYDLMQVQIGSCSLNDIAVALACPVVAKYPSRDEMVVHGGAVHLSKESININGTEYFGLPVYLSNNGWEATHSNGYVKALSQEHGIIKCSENFIESVNIGDLIAILPVHSCLCADLMSGYKTLDSKEVNHFRNYNLDYHG